LCQSCQGFHYLEIVNFFIIEQQAMVYLLHQYYLLS